MNFCVKVISTDVMFWMCDDEIIYFQTRKSERIAQREKSPTPTEPPKYVSKPYCIAELCKYHQHLSASSSSAYRYISN